MRREEEKKNSIQLLVLFVQTPSKTNTRYVLEEEREKKTKIQINFIFHFYFHLF